MKDFTATLYIFLVALTLGLILGRLCGESLGRTTTQQEAVDRGVAEWRVIEGSSLTEFRWKEVP